MAWRIGDYIVCGELNNSRRNTVHGWFDFGDETGVRLELTGNFEGDLAGRHFRFTCQQSVEPSVAEEERNPDDLESMQIGATGSMQLRMVKIPLCSIEELTRLGKEGKPLPVAIKPCLYLEWFSQNGRVVAEIVAPEIEYITEDDEPALDVAPEPLPGEQPQGSGPQIIGFSVDDDGKVKEVEFSGNKSGDSDADVDDGENDAAEDEYGLFPADLDDQLRAANKPAEAAADAVEPYADQAESGSRAWDEVIPGIDEETKKMYEQWDEIFDGESDEPLTTLFDPPMKIPPVDQVSGEAEATELLKVLLGRLAELGVAFDMCEHCSSLDAYRILIDEVLPDAQIHPELAGTGFVQHYSTWESCPQCEAKFEEEYRREHPDAPADPPTETPE